MAQGLSQEQVQDPAYLFAAGEEFVHTFGAEAGIDLINPVEHPMQFAEAAARLNPRHPQSVFKQPGTVSAEYADRYTVADNGLPAWAASHEAVINSAAHDLGIRDRELGATFQHDFPQGHSGLGLVLEGANRASRNRAFAMAEAIRSGDITVGQMLVAGTDRAVGEREGHGDLRVGFAVADKVVTELYAEYSDVFGPGGVPLDALHVRTRRANTREVATEAVLYANVGSVVMAGSNIYGSWMRTDLATVQHNLDLGEVGFGANQDDPKAARTPVIWTAEVAQTLVSAAHLQHAHNTKKY